MKVKVLTNPFRVGVFTEGKCYEAIRDMPEFDILWVVDNGGIQRPMSSKYCEVIEETFESQDIKKGTIDFLYNDKAPDKLTFKKLQQYASDLNIDITFLPDNKVTVYIDNTLDKTYTVETEDELEELVKALRLVDKYLDKD